MTFFYTKVLKGSNWIDWLWYFNRTKKKKPWNGFIRFTVVAAMWALNKFNIFLFLHFRRAKRDLSPGAEYAFCINWAVSFMCCFFPLYFLLLCILCFPFFFSFHFSRTFHLLFVLFRLRVLIQLTLCQLHNRNEA